MNKFSLKVKPKYLINNEDFAERLYEAKQIVAALPDKEINAYNFYHLLAERDYYLNLYLKETNKNG